MFDQAEIASAILYAVGFIFASLLALNVWFVKRLVFKLVIVDYHRPNGWHPLWLPMRGILAKLEPFALDLWNHEVTEWLPVGFKPASISQRTSFGGLYQLIEITR